jgi:Fe-Mn family superoxide dismutase|tara:strand:+ start:2797 stop:3483 length:687 start_codon:yes stop_codon:yes gene_type:complete
MITKDDVRGIIRDSLGLEEEEELNEALVLQQKQFDLPTELLSQKNKKAHEGLYENYVKTFNRVSAELDAVDKDEAGLNHSYYRSLKVDETYNMNAAYLHELYFNNVSDVQSEVSMDTLSFMRLERDFGSFDAWQEDFIACGKSARNGWVVTGYNTYTQRYMNTLIDLHSLNVPVGFYPVIVVDVWEHAYYRDYLSKRKSYIHAMMKELNWQVIEDRFKRAEKIAKALK